MLYASAGFLFLFLPVALAIYALFPAKLRKYVLIAESVIYYILANLRTPLAIPLFAFIVALTVVAGRLMARRGFKWIYYFVVTLDVSLIVVLRLLYEYGLFDFPLGAAVFTLMSVSYLTDIKRGDVEHGSIFDDLLYLTFFPVIVAGPVIKYKNFVKHTENISFGINNFADGARRFMLGLVGYIALAAVMTQACGIVIERSGSSIYIPFGILAAFLIYASFFLALAGWGYIAGGVAQMFGVKLPQDSDFAPAAITPVAYFSGLLKGFAGWLEDYMITPLFGLPGKRSRFTDAAGGAVFVLAFSLWIRTTTATLLGGALVAVLSLVLSMSGATGLMKRRKYLMPLGWLFSTVSVAFFWLSCVADGVEEIITMLSRLSLNVADYLTSYIFISLSGGRYITVVVAALIITPLIYYGSRIITRIPRRHRPKISIVGTLLLLGAFVFTLLFFMPDFPQYASKAFEYLVF